MTLGEQERREVEKITGEKLMKDWKVIRYYKIRSSLW